MKVLALGAHFDDVELGCGGTLLKHKARGDEIWIMVVTHSSYHSPSKQFDRSRDQARKEGIDSAKLLGANLICLEKDPLVLYPSEQFVLEIEEHVSRIKPDRVYTHQHNDSHGDHAAVGYVSMRACRKCDQVLLYRSNWYIMDNCQDDDYYVDITEHIDDKLTLIRLFESEMKNVNYSWIDFVKKQNCAAGAKIQAGYAETFRLSKMVWRNGSV